MLIRITAFAIVVVALCGCAPLKLETTRYFWPPIEGAEKIEYLNFYYMDEDLLRGVDRRFEEAILGKRKPQRLVSQPYTVASDGKGRILIGDFGEKKVIIFDLPARSFRYLVSLKGLPQKVVVDKRGEIWVLVAKNPTLYHYSADEKLIRTITFPGITRAASMTIDAERQRIYLTETPSHRICVYDFSGNLLKTIGMRGRESGQFNYPSDIDLDEDGNIYVIDTMNARIQVFTSEGEFIRAFGERGTVSGAFSSPKGIAVSSSGLVYVTDALQNKIVIFNDRGDYLLTVGGTDFYDGKNVRPGGLYFPAGIDVDKNDRIYVADFFNGMVQEFQYLTDEYLLMRPILSEERYQLQETDLNRGSRGGTKPLINEQVEIESIKTPARKLQ